ncbi:MAG: hypothetical protein NZM31_02465 [Gemmatales bacterium]|nr:hypothetical protein [Gemmatales bacterium]MDW8385862.1 alpha/beta hydrolase [Gemmatales bacterium]
MDANRSPTWKRRSGFLLLATGVFSVMGCLSGFHPIRPPQDWAVAPPPTPPRAAQDHVYVFFVHGLDPLDYANLSGLRKFVHDLGYTRTYYGQVYHGPHFEKEILEIRSVDEQARFVLVGFSAGANVVRNMANNLADEGVFIDLMVYLGGNTLEDEDRNRPANVGKVLHVLCSGYIWKGYDIAGVENIRYPDKWHFDSPSHPETLRRLAEELLEVSSRVTALVPIEDEQPQQAPMPRPVSQVRKPASVSPDWDLLKPRAALEPPTSRWPLRKPSDWARTLTHSKQPMAAK